MEEEEIQGEAGEGGYKKWLKLNAQQKLELMREILQHYYRTIILSKGKNMEDDKKVIQKMLKFMTNHKFQSQHCFDSAFSRNYTIVFETTTIP